MHFFSLSDKIQAMKFKNPGLLLIHLAVFFFGFPGVIGKLLPYSPVQLTWFRVFLASLGLLLVLSWQKERILIPSSGHRLLILLSGLLLAGHWITFFQSVKVSTVAVGLLSYSTFPVFTVFLEPLLLKTRFRRTNLGLTVACFFGLTLMVPRFSFSNQVFVGVLWGIASGLTFSLLTIINRNLVRFHSSLLLAFFQDLITTIILLPIFLATSITFSLKAFDLWLLLFLGLVCTAGAHTLFIRGLRFLEAQASSLISALEPVYGIIFGLLFLKEIPSLRTISGGLIILSSVILVSLINSRPGTTR